MSVNRSEVTCRASDVANLYRLEEYSYLIKCNDVRYSICLYLVELVLGYVYLLRLQWYSRSLTRALKVVNWELGT